MRQRDLKFVIALVLWIATVICSQEVDLDTIPPPPMSPVLETETEIIDFSGLNIAWAGSFLPKTIFFDPANDVISQGYEGVLSKIAARIVQNPDIYCRIRGYYSHEIDGIASPFEGEELAYRRANAVREVLLLLQPQLDLKIEIASSGYEFTETFAHENSVFDPRVEIVPTISGWNQRVIVATDVKPYWRRGFRIISKKQSDFLRDILLRNPDLDLLFSSGELGVSAKEAISRIEVVPDQFKKDMKWKNGRQFVAVYGGKSKSGEMTIDLWPSFCGPEPLNGNLLWVEPAAASLDPIRFNPSVDSASSPYSFRIDRDMQTSREPVAWGSSTPPKLVKFEPLEDAPLIVPSDCEFSLVTWGRDHRVERSEWIHIDVDFDSAYSEMAVIPVVPFVLNSLEPICHWEGAMSPIVSRIEFLVKKGGKLHIQVTGHSVEVENDADSLSIGRATYLWDRLGYALIAAFDRNNLEDLGSYLSNRNVDIEIGEEVHAVGNAASILPWAAGPILDLPPEHLIPWGAVATIKWEYHSDE